MLWNGILVPFRHPFRKILVSAEFTHEVNEMQTFILLHRQVSQKDVAFGEYFSCPVLSPDVPV